MATALNRLEGELREIFGSRLRSLVSYGERTRAARHASADSHGGRRADHSSDARLLQVLTIVDSLTRDDLRACAGRVASWHDAGVATPLLLAADEFDRSLDAFPLEFGAILADHTVIAGANPFERLTVDAGDVRRAVEVQARSHLLHLREGYVETRGRADVLAALIVRSAPAFAALVTSVSRLEGHETYDPADAARHGESLLGVDNNIITKIVSLVGLQKMASADADQLFPSYLDAVQRLVQHVDNWRAR
jgi:hypothetical protein